MSARPAITALGAITPVGLSAPATCAALRAAISRMNALEGWTDDGKLPDPDVIGGRVPVEHFDPGFADEKWPGHERWKVDVPAPHQLITPGAERLVELALPAAEEAWAASGLDAETRGVGLYLGLDDRDDGAPLAAAIARHLGVRFEPVRIDSLGRAAALAALHRAARHMREGRVSIALVGGVDSLLRRAPLARLAEAGALRTDKNPRGIIPGEAAAFVVLEAAPRDGRALATLAGSAVTEEKTAGTDDPNQSVGLTKVVRGARQGSPELKSFPRVVCDLNGEHYRSREWAFAYIRALGDVHREEGGPSGAEIWHPADCIGDSGAGSGALDVVWAVTAMQKGYALSDHTLVWGASDGPLRAAAMLVHETDR